jgi:2-methylcitrate dehydratase
MDRTLKFLTDYATSLTYEQLPSDAIRQVKRRVIDALGCAMGGYTEDVPKLVRGYAAEATAVNSGATILGTRRRTAPELAAFANGVMVRYLDFNDSGTSKEVGGHPSGNIPAILAAAEYAGAGGEAFICAVVLAYEIHGRMADELGLWRRGWDHASYMTLASAAGAAKVLELDHARMANALALATVTGFFLGQTRTGSVSKWKGCAEGNGSRNGVFAALLAQRGMTGPEAPFEGAKGLFKVASSPVDMPPFGGTNGEAYKIQIAQHKYFPSDHETQCCAHPFIELGEILRGRLDDIEKIVVDTYRLTMEVAADSPEKWDPQTRETADHSLPYTMALCLTQGGYWLDDFELEKIRNPALRPLMKKIEVRETEECNSRFPESNSFRIEVTMKNGEKIRRGIDHAKGDPNNPMTDDEIVTKFRKLCAPVMSDAQMDHALNRRWQLEGMSDISEIVRLFELKGFNPQPFPSAN